jgi:WD40 repeat protein
VHIPGAVSDYAGCIFQGWNCTQIFEGHSHYVMQVIFNPKDANTFASASLDRTVKVCYGLRSDVY